MPTISISWGFFKLFWLLYILFWRGIFCKVYKDLFLLSSNMTTPLSTMAPSFEHWLVFSYDPEEIIPSFLGFGHGLKSENLVKCNSKLSCKTDTFYVSHKTMDFKNKHIEMYITFSLVTPENGEEDGYYNFTRGVVYIDKKSYDIKNYTSYNSLQIDKWCYDNIGVVKLDSNIFAEDSVEISES
jgi:hypothetical protein